MKPINITVTIASQSRHFEFEEMWQVRWFVLVINWFMRFVYWIHQLDKKGVEHGRD